MTPAASIVGVFAIAVIAWLGVLALFEQALPSSNPAATLAATLAANAVVVATLAANAVVVATLAANAVVAIRQAGVVAIRQAAGLLC